MENTTTYSIYRDGERVKTSGDSLYPLWERIAKHAASKIFTRNDGSNWSEVEITNNGRRYRFFKRWSLA